jgi:sugar lactone lactonase YvrE
MVRISALLMLAALGGLSQDFTDIKIEKVVTGTYRYTNAPAWSREGAGALFFTDQPANVVVEWAPGGQPEKFLENAPGASGLAFDTQGRLYVCESRARRVVRVDQKKRVQTIAEKYQGKRLNAPDDLVVRKDGNVYFTDPAFGYQEDGRDLDFYGVYRITSRGEVDLVAKSGSRPRGIALAPNGRTLYVSDADLRTVRAYDLDRGGAASNERVFLRGIQGVPGGLCVDEKGNVYVAAKHVEVFSAEGKHLRTIEFQTPPSNCAFGDGDLQSLYVTAGPAIYRIRLNVKGASQY